MYQPDLAALQSGNGDDDLTVVATITMQSEESLGLDSANVQQQEASLGGQAAPQVQEEVKKEEEKVELPPEKSPEPTPIAEEKEPEKKIVEVNPRSRRHPAKPRRSNAPRRALWKLAATRCFRSTTAGSIRL